MQYFVGGWVDNLQQTKDVYSAPKCGKAEEKGKRKKEQNLLLGLRLDMPNITELLLDIYQKPFNELRSNFQRKFVVRMISFSGKSFRMK